AATRASLSTCCNGVDVMDSMKRRRRVATVTRRRWFGAAAAVAAIAARTPFAATPKGMFTVYTFGDSILDCARYNEHGVHPGQLIVRNDDTLFPAFRRRDLSSLGPARLDHRAQDGARVDDLARQARGVRSTHPAVALITIGGNDLL